MSNLAATMAGAPSLISTFVAAFGQFAGTGFTDAERQVLLLSNAVANRCAWAAEVLAYPGVPASVADTDPLVPQLPIVPVRFARDGRQFDYFSTVTTLGTPQDVTLQELRIECFFPADERTRRPAASA